jgi:tetratricopeptide (TPR) repeat protein
MRTARIVLLIGLAAAVSLLVVKRQAAENLAREQVDRAKTSLMNLLTARIDESWHRGDYEKCVRLFRMQMRLDPKWVESYDGAAWLLWSMGKFDEAEAIYKEGIANNPGNYRLYFELAHMYYRTARSSLYEKSEEESRRLYEQAVEQLRLAIQRQSPSHVNYLLARIFHTLGRYAEERAVLEKMLQKYPEDSFAKRDLKRLEEMGKQAQSAGEKPDK